LNLQVKNTTQLQDIPACIRLLDLVRRTRPDVIHCHSSKAGILGRVAGFFAGISVVYTPNAYYGMRDGTAWLTIFFNFLERVFACCGHTVNVSRDEARFAREILHVPPHLQSIIPNGVDTACFRPADLPAKLSARKRFGLPEDAFIIGTLGRLSFQKDPLTLLEAFARLARNRSDVFLAHLGTGNLVPTFDARLSDLGLASRYRRIDYLSEPSAFYHALDLFALSSRYEGLSIAVLEAMASGLPLVLTDVPGNRDFFDLGLSHLTSAPPGNPLTLAKALEQAIDSIRSTKVTNHREIAMRSFSEDLCFEKILVLYKTLVANHQKKSVSS